jgi:hypothetical protein
MNYNKEKIIKMQKIMMKIDLFLERTTRTTIYKKNQKHLQYLI